MAETKQLSMVRVHVDAANVARTLVAAGLAPRHDDVGVPVHAALAAVFGEGAVQPFRVLDEPSRWPKAKAPAAQRPESLQEIADRDGADRWIPVLGYTTLTEEALRHHAQAFADPAQYASCDWRSFAVKPMPDEWEARRLRFELRACPVVRLASEVEVTDRGGNVERHRPGAEVDAWLHRRWLSRCPDEAVSREEVYAAWLRERVGDAATVESVQLVAFRRRRLLRLDHATPRRARILERPEALLRGSLLVGEPDAFRRLLARGVGRHRAFGFGMLLLQPPQ